MPHLIVSPTFRRSLLSIFSRRTDESMVLIGAVFAPSSKRGLAVNLVLMLLFM
jgi:hypothetical protein